MHSLDVHMRPGGSLSVTILLLEHLAHLRSFTQVEYLEIHPLGLLEQGPGGLLRKPLDCATPVSIQLAGETIHSSSAS